MGLIQALFGKDTKCNCKHLVRIEEREKSFEKNRTVRELNVEWQDGEKESYEADYAIESGSKVLLSDLEVYGCSVSVRRSSTAGRYEKVIPNTSTTGNEPVITGNAKRYNIEKTGKKHVIEGNVSYKEYIYSNGDRAIKNTDIEITRDEVVENEE